MSNENYQTRKQDYQKWGLPAQEGSSRVTAVDPASAVVEPPSPWNPCRQTQNKSGRFWEHNKPYKLRMSTLHWVFIHSSAESWTINISQYQVRLFVVSTTLKNILMNNVWWRRKGNIRKRLYLDNYTFEIGKTTFLHQNILNHFRRTKL